MCYAAAHQKMATIEHEQSLIIDPGARTFDWLVARGMRLVLKTSDSVTRGVSHVLRATAGDISTEIGTPYTDLDAIDRALRTGKNLMVYQKTYDLSKLMPVAHSVAQRAVGAMLESIPADYSFQNIILVGAVHGDRTGGDFCKGGPCLSSRVRRNRPARTQNPRYRSTLLVRRDRTVGTARSGRTANGGGGGGSRIRRGPAPRRRGAKCSSGATDDHFRGGCAGGTPRSDSLGRAVAELCAFGRCLPTVCLRAKLREDQR